MWLSPEQRAHPFKTLHELHGLRITRCQHVAPALAHIRCKNARGSHIEGGYCSNCGSRICTAHMRV
eukprot:1538829-Pyramimonas_sp.AAC.1